MHDYRRGVLCLAHKSGVEVYSLIALGEGVTLSSVSVNTFVVRAAALMINVCFDGIDLDLALLKTDPGTGLPLRSAVLQGAEIGPLKAILASLQVKIIELMARDSRGYSLTMAMPCKSRRAPNIADVLGLVNKVNLMTFDFNSPLRSELAVPSTGGGVEGEGAP